MTHGEKTSRSDHNKKIGISGVKCIWEIPVTFKEMFCVQYSLLN